MSGLTNNVGFSFNGLTNLTSGNFDALTLGGTSITNVGYSVYLAFVYQQTATPPSAPSGGSFNFSTKILTAPSGWTTTLPASSTTPTYICLYYFSTNTPSTTITATSWTAPVVFAQNGANGFSVYLASVYYQTSSAPSTPSGGSYNFSTTTLTAPSGGWTTTLPASSTTQTYIASYLFSTQTPSTTITATSWTSPVIFAQNGSNGFSVYLGAVYYQTASAPSAPSGGSYNFSTTTLTAPSGGWSTTIPALSLTPTYIATYLFSTQTPSSTVSATTWSSPVIFAQLGTFSPSGSNYGDYPYWNGSAWAVADLNVILGKNAGATSQTSGSVAVGQYSGNQNQGNGSGFSAVAVGQNSGYQNQGGLSVACGVNSGYVNMGQNCVGIGNSALYQNAGQNSLGIGAGAGEFYAGQNTVAIGLNAANGLSSGSGSGNSSIAIGAYAAYDTVHVQPANQIVINATGNYLWNSKTNACFIAPLANTNTSGNPLPLQYNGATKELAVGNGRPYLFVSGNTGSTVISGASKVPFNFVFSDSWITGTYNTSTYQWTCPYAGYYMVSVQVYQNYNANASNVRVDLYINNTNTNHLGGCPIGTASGQPGYEIQIGCSPFIGYFSAGDTVDIRPNLSVAWYFALSPHHTAMEICMM